MSSSTTAPLKASIVSLGTALPQEQISQQEAAALAKTFCGEDSPVAPLLPKLYRKAGVESRGSVLLSRENEELPRQHFYPPIAAPNDYGPDTAQRMTAYGQHAPLLATKAAAKAIEAAQIDPSTITHLVTVSCTGFYAPGIDITLIEQLGLRSTVERVQVGFMGCHGAINGLRAAAGLAESNPEAVVLLCAVEVCTLHNQYGSDPEQIVANALFADGAAAAIIRCSPPATACNLQLRGFGSCVFPDSRDAMSWEIGNNGFVMSLSSKLPDLLRKELPNWLHALLSRYDLQVEHIRHWAVHPGGPRILDAVQNCLSLEPAMLQHSREVLRRYGNMSSPTVLFILEQFLANHLTGPTLMLAFGPGISAEAALLVPGTDAGFSTLPKLLA